MAAEIKQAIGVDATLIKGSGGQFEIVADGQLVFSKKALGRYPERGEVLSLLPKTG